MPVKILVTEMDGTPPQICFADHAGDFNPDAVNDLRSGSETDVEMDLQDVGDTLAWQSALADLGMVRFFITQYLKVGERSWERKSPSSSCLHCSFSLYL